MLLNNDQKIKNAIINSHKPKISNMSYHTRVYKSMTGSGDIRIHSVQFWVIQKNIFSVW